MWICIFCPVHIFLNSTLYGTAPSELCRKTRPSVLGRVLWPITLKIAKATLEKRQGKKLRQGCVFLPWLSTVSGRSIAMRTLQGACLGSGSQNSLFWIWNQEPRQQGWSCRSAQPRTIIERSQPYWCKTRNLHLNSPGASSPETDLVCIVM